MLTIELNCSNFRIMEIDPKALSRFWSRVSVQKNGCWEWIGSKDKRGYGHISAGKNRLELAHRRAYSMFVCETIPPELDHTCRFSSCVNPDHLEAVSHAENMRRARGFKRPDNAERNRSRAKRVVA